MKEGCLEDSLRSTTMTIANSNTNLFGRIGLTDKKNGLLTILMISICCSNNGYHFAKAFSSDQYHFRRMGPKPLQTPFASKKSINYIHSPLTNLYSSTKEREEVDSSSSDSSTKKKSKFIPQRAMNIYVNYVTRLWKETNKTSRQKIANQRAFYAIKQVQHLLREGEEYVNIMNTKQDDSLEEIENRLMARNDLLNACDTMLGIIGKEQEEVSSDIAISSNGAANGKALDTTLDTAKQSGKKVKKKKKNSRSILFGAAMGAIVACWVFSGNFLFTSLFTLMTVLGQLEYYRMVMKVGIYPARKISVLGACAMFVTALFAPAFHQICLPFFASYAMIWFLTMRRTVSTIPEIATTFTGMFYLGYIPSFWVRIRCIQSAPDQPATLLRPILGPMLDSINSYAKSTFPYFSQFITSPISAGSVFIFWTWISIAFSDVGAYFTGRKYGKNKLGSIFPAAGAASPNKTVEGYLGGTLVCAAIATLGSIVMQWPYWYLTGPIHGIALAFLGLVGDLTASMLKRDSGMKDFGDLLPEHGGIMDRVDSFIFTAPYSWLVCQFIIPALRTRARLAIP